MNATGLFRMKKLRGSSKVLIASRHNKRTLQSERGAAGHIDPAQSDLNYSLHGPATADAVAALANTLMSEAGIKSLKANAVMALELLFSLPRVTAIDPQCYFADCLQWAAENFGGIENVLSADVHLDEAAPHLHVLILPLVNRRMNGSSLFGNRTRLLRLQDDFHKAVSGRYGLSKGGPVLRGQAKEKTALAVIQRLRQGNDPAQASPVWSVIREMIDRDPAPFAELLGIDFATPMHKPMRTMAQIFTSKGKGSQRRTEPIGNDRLPIGKTNGMPRNAPLSCVGVPAEHADDDGSADGDAERVVDRSDCDFDGWDE